MKTCPTKGYLTENKFVDGLFLIEAKSHLVTRCVPKFPNLLSKMTLDKYFYIIFHVSFTIGTSKWLLNFL